MKKSLVIVSVLIAALLCFSGCTALGALNKSQLDPHSEDINENIDDNDNSDIEEYLDEIGAKATERLEGFAKSVEENEVVDDVDEEPKEYVLMGIRDRHFVPTLTFYEEDNTFSFFFSYYSDDILEGDYKIKGNNLSANTYDDKFYFTFEIMDEKSLKFIAEKSSDLSKNNDKAKYPIEDRTVFKLKK